MMADDADEEADDYESFVYYIHRWHNPDKPEDAPVSIPEMEAYIMQVLGEEAKSLRDPIDPDMTLFYHDNWDGGKLKIATEKSFADRSHANVRRVLGCGHFVMSLLYITLNCMQAQEGPDWPYARFWPKLREAMLGTGLMRRDTACNAAGVYRFLQAYLFKQIYERIEDSDPYKEIVRVPLTKLRVLSSPCKPNADESTEKYKRNYNQFLVLHLYVMDEMQVLNSDKHRDQYLNLVRQATDAKAGWTRPAIDKSFIERGGSLRAAMSSRRRPKLLVETQQSSEAENPPPPEPQQPVPPPTESENPPEDSTKPLQDDAGGQREPIVSSSELKPNWGAGQAKVRGRDGLIVFPKSEPSGSWRRRVHAGSEDEFDRFSSDRNRRHRWHRSATFRPAESWSRAPRSWSVGYAVRIREVDRHWRLGCIGCRPGLVVSRRLPRAGSRRAQRSRQPTRRRRYCKWITVKRTVLIRRKR